MPVPTTSDNEKLASRRSTLAGLAFSLPAVAWIALFFAAPLVIMSLYSLMPLAGNGAFSLDNYRHFLGEPAYVQAIWNSVVTTAIVVVISLLLAYPFAYILAYKVPKRWQRLALACAILPFWTSYVVRSYAWLLVLAPTGIVNWVLMSLHITDHPITFAYNPGATDLGFVHFFIMLNALTIYANLVQINPRYVLAAQDLGASAWKSFIAVTLPLSIPGMTVGAFLTVVLCIGDFITPQILGGNKELLLPQVIMMQIQRQLDLPMASTMSLVLTLIVAVVYLALQRKMRMSRL